MPIEFNSVDLNTLFDNMTDAVYLLDPKSSNVLWCNRPAYEDLGYKKQEILNHSVLSLQHHVVGMPQWTEVAQVIRNNKSFTFVGNHQHKNGGDISVEIITTVFEYKNQEYFLSVARNIGKRLEHEKDLNTRDHRIWFALNEASDGMWEWEIDTGKVFFSPQLKKMLGYGPDEMLPNLETWSNNIHPDDLKFVMASINGHLDGSRSHYEHQYRLKNRNGHYMWVHDKGKICERDESGYPIMMVGMVHNINKLKRLEKQLESLASEDFLTKLPNRRSGEERTKEMVERANKNQEPLCFAMLDLDFFKRVNDEYGHKKGDLVLETAANILKNFARPNDFIYRWGGEEFIYVFSNTTLTDANKLSDKIHVLFKETDWQQFGIGKQTISIGIASTEPQSIKSFETLFQLADCASYNAKNTGRNQTVIANTTIKEQCLKKMDNF